MTAPPVILASGSATRRKMLADVGLPVHDAIAPHVDEDGIKAGLQAEGATAAEVAETLAELKATRVGRKAPAGALVLGADQMLECDGRWFDKPADRAAARAQLLELRGKTHTLISGAVIVRDGQRIWHALGRATLTMRPFSEDFLDAYLDAVGDAAYASVGAYQLEGQGAQLFSKVEGDLFTILGLPLLEVLDFLRSWNVVRP